MKVGENKKNRGKNMVFSFQILCGIIEMSDREVGFLSFPTPNEERTCSRPAGKRMFPRKNLMGDNALFGQTQQIRALG